MFNKLYTYSSVVPHFCNGTLKNPFSSNLSPHPLLVRLDFVDSEHRESCLAGDKTWVVNAIYKYKGVISVITSGVNGRGYVLGHVFLSVCLHLPKGPKWSCITVCALVCSSSWTVKFLSSRWLLSVMEQEVHQHWGIFSTLTPQWQWQ